MRQDHAIRGRAVPGRRPQRVARPLPTWVAWAVVAVGSVATAVYAASPRSDVGEAAFTLVALAVPIGMVVGVRRNRPARTWPWALLGAATVASAIGASARSALTGTGVDVGALVAHAITYSGYLLIGAGLLGMLRARRPGARDLASLLDGALVAVSTWVAVWSFLVLPAVARGGDAGLQVLGGLYPTTSMVLAYLGIQLALTQAHRAPAFLLLTACLGAVLVGDLGYALVDAGYLRTDPAVLDAAYALAFLCAAGAVLHPTMRVLTERQPIRERPMGAGRLAIVSSALLAPVAAAAVRPPDDVLEWSMLLGCAVAAMVLVVLRIARAVNEHAASEARLTRQAHEDALTGLANRARALEHLTDALRGTGEDGVAVLFLDLDRFKDVNDTWGHTVGDQLLVAVGRRLGAQLRAGDLLARLGGDEFVIIAPRVSSPQAATALAVRASAELGGDVVLDVCTTEVTASIGVVHVDAGHRGVPEDLLRDADTAMYRAKGAGGAAISLFDDSMRADVARRLDLEGALRHVVERAELRLHYQPVVDLPTGALVGFEALLRWDRPGHGLVPPLDFIPVAEGTGAIVAIGAWVIDEGCRQLAAWDEQLDLDRSLTLALNLSARQLRDRAVVDVVAGALARNGIAGSRLVVEITESVMLDDVLEAQDALGELRALGVRLAADDFGTGYSSLSYLKQYPIDQVKIDRSFVSGLGSVVVAEGIETSVQRERLSELGCEHAQGYLFAPALTAVAAGALLERVTSAAWVPWDVDGQEPPGLRALAAGLPPEVSEPSA